MTTSASSRNTPSYPRIESVSKARCYWPFDSHSAATHSGPRAMININDGMLGQSTISGNVLFNGCRESDDHGNFNSCVHRTYHLALVIGRLRERLTQLGSDANAARCC